MDSGPAFSSSSRAAQSTQRKLGVVIGLLLLVLVAHLAVIDWLRHDLPLLALDDDEDAGMISITLQPAPEPNAKPVVPKVKEVSPPPVDKAVPVAAVPVTEPPVAAVPEVPAPAPAPAPDAAAGTADSSTPASAADSNAISAADEPATLAPVADEPAPQTAAPALFERVSLPPSAELNYVVVGVRNGSRVNGHGKILWKQDGQRYSVTGEIGLLVFTLLSYKSVGEVGKTGLAPTTYAEKRIGRSQTNTHFQRERNTISFSASTDAYPYKGGEQDRSSWIWQLASLGRGDPDKFEPGLVFDMSVAGHKSLDGWRVYVNGRENIDLAQGAISTWRLSVIPGENSFDKQFDLWLAPERQWYPVMLRHVDKAGNSVEMRLTEVKQ